jgi:hypothetical protein
MCAHSGGRLGARWSWVGTVLPLVMLACAGGAPNGATTGGVNAPPAAGNGTPAPAGDGDVQALFEREAEPIQKHVIRGGDSFTAYIEAKSPPKLERKGAAWSVTADLGWGGSSVECFAYDDVIDTGTTAHTMLKAVGKAVTFKGLGPYFFDHVAFDPMLGIRGVYHVVRDGTTLAGDFKLAVMARAERPVMCWHDAPGYAKSFARVTTEFAKSFQLKATNPEPTRAELWTLTLDGTPIGFSRDQYFLVEDGNVRKVSLSARFVPTAPGEMSFGDNVQIATSNRDGTFTSGRFISIENGESDLTIDVELNKAGYAYVGTIQNKDVKGSFKAKGPIKDHRAVEKKLRALAGKTKKTKFEQWEYLPSLDAVQATRVSYEVTPAVDGMTILSTMASRGVTLKATPGGVVTQIQMAAGPKKVQADLVEAKGEL